MTKDQLAEIKQIISDWKAKKEFKFQVKKCFGFEKRAKDIENGSPNFNLWFRIEAPSYAEDNIIIESLNSDWFQTDKNNSANELKNFLSDFDIFFNNQYGWKLTTLPDTFNEY